MAVITIDIISDAICPWCFIGYRDLQKAISLYQKTYPGGSKDEFQLLWKPYFTGQEPPRRAISPPNLLLQFLLCSHRSQLKIKSKNDSSAYIYQSIYPERMLRKMGPKMTQGAQTRLKRVGAALGINFKFGGYIGSSRLAHVLLHTTAVEKGSLMRCKVSEILFQYQFEIEEDISCIDTLVRSAVEAGLDESEAKGWLAGEGAGNGVGEIIEAADKQARGNGVQGVPHFIIGGNHHIEGAVDVAEFLENVVEDKERSLGDEVVTVGGLLVGWKWAHVDWKPTTGVSWKRAVAKKNHDRDRFCFIFATV
ncbi:hypothetical protein AJ78_06729 [Emergomyces pasteurianus Ep9510]|uniref:DSBA-like thioredoxin domain-containing protein n=1 Tax=Emergomyces pasteurianus Ep9510 TaxID=1447872 RepID=A0A1J9PXV2_9EURO|nr:hypothetical protein AJ78_06729 [Emergomyces pasteurianus Ep9510]